MKFLIALGLIGAVMIVAVFIALILFVTAIAVDIASEFMDE